MSANDTPEPHDEEESIHAIDLIAQRTAALNHKLLHQFGPSHKLMMGSLVNTQLQIGGALAETLRQIKAASVPLRLAIHQVNFPLANLQKVFQPSDLSLAWRQRWAPLFGEISDALKELPSRMQDGLIALAEAGWYLDPEMPITAITRFREELANKPIGDIQEGLASYFRKHLDRIEADLTRQHPHRAKIIGSAFLAHRAGNYEASIPLIFAQVDGITNDLANSHLFRKGLTGYASKADLKDFGRAYLEPLLQQIPIKYGEGRRGDGFTELNRHAVMHGEALDYGTEGNGLKAISLLNYVSFILGDKPEYSDG